MGGVKDYRADCDRKGITGTPYVAQALTWLSQHRWEEHQHILERSERPKLP